MHQSLHDMLDLYESSAVHGLISIPAECPESPIVALYTPYPRDLAHHCQSSGYIVRAVVPPTVPDGTERVRICLHSGNTRAQVQSFVSTVKRWIDLKTEVAETACELSQRPKL